MNTLSPDIYDDLIQEAYPDNKRKAYSLLRKRYDLLTQLFTEAHDKTDIRRLVALCEYVRGGGIFYHRYEERQSILLNKMLQICLDMMKHPDILKSEEIWFFICNYYDLDFHQIKLKRFPPETAALYFEVTRQVLQPHFHQLYKNLNWYGTTISFIGKTDYWFEKREEEFFELYPLLMAITGPEVNTWHESHEDLKKKIQRRNKRAASR